MGEESVEGFSQKRRSVEGVERVGWSVEGVKGFEELPESLAQACLLVRRHLTLLPVLFRRLVQHRLLTQQHPVYQAAGSDGLLVPQYDEYHGDVHLNKFQKDLSN